VSADVYVAKSVFNETYGGVAFSVYSDSQFANLLQSVGLATYSSETNNEFVYKANVTIPANVYADVYLKATYGPYEDTYNDPNAPKWPAGAALTASNVTSNSLMLNWKAAEDNNTAADQLKYLVHKDGTLLNTVTGVTYLYVSGLSANTTYKFEVWAEDKDGKQSDTSLSTSVITDRVRSSSGGGGGGGGAPSNTVDGNKIDVGSDGNVSADALKKAFEAGAKVEITVKGDTANLPASALLNAPAGATVTIRNEAGVYHLPVNLIKFDALAKQLGVSAADLKIVVTIKKVTGGEADAVADAVDALGAKSLTDAVDFSIAVEGKDGKKINITSFDSYITREMPLTTKPNGTATVVLYNPATGSLSFVPATFSNTNVVFHRPGNSIYTVIETNKSFDDISGHWAKADVELLASKLIVDGTSDTTFEADRGITRAEFAALVVRSLGLTPDSTSSAFSDVKSNAWYAGVVAAAAKAGIINGYEDGTFRPNNQISREELAAMVVRAMKFAGLNTDISAAKKNQLLSKFEDADNIVWAHNEIAAAIDAGVINGLTDTTIGSDSNATRAESATMLKRFLKKAGFIN